MQANDALNFRFYSGLSISHSSRMVFSGEQTSKIAVKGTGIPYNVSLITDNFNFGRKTGMVKFKIFRRVDSFEL